MVATNCVICMEAVLATSLVACPACGGSCCIDCLRANLRLNSDRCAFCARRGMRACLRAYERTPAAEAAALAVSVGDAISAPSPEAPVRAPLAAPGELRAEFALALRAARREARSRALTEESESLTRLLESSGAAALSPADRELALRRAAAVKTLLASGADSTSSDDESATGVGRSGDGVGGGCSSSDSEDSICVVEEGAKSAPSAALAPSEPRRKTLLGWLEAGSAASASAPARTNSTASSSIRANKAARRKSLLLTWLASAAAPAAPAAPALAAAPSLRASGAAPTASTAPSGLRRLPSLPAQVRALWAAVGAAAARRALAAAERVVMLEDSGSYDATRADAPLARPSAKRPPDDKLLRAPPSVQEIVEL